MQQQYAATAPAPRPSISDEMVASQRRLLHNLEQDCGVTRPLFLDSPRSWADTFLARASGLTQRSIGRYRLDFDMNAEGVQELWFDLEASGPELKTQGWVHQQWPGLKECALRLVAVLCPQLPEQSVYLSASGSGLHVRAFVRGVESEAHRKLLLCFLLEEAKLGNSKSESGAGCDYPSTLSIRRKVREVGGPNADKRLAGKADYRHYCTWLPLSELEGLPHYPFCEFARDVAYPPRYQAVALPDAWRRDALAAPPRDEASPCRTEADDARTTRTHPLPRRERSPQQAVCSPSRPLSDFWQLLRRDRKLAALFYGRKPIAGLRDQSRSGREMSLVCKLRWYGFDFGQVDALMRKARIGKWKDASNTYISKTYATA